MKPTIIVVEVVVVVVGDFVVCEMEAGNEKVGVWRDSASQRGILILQPKVDLKFRKVKLTFNQVDICLKEDKKDI